MAATALMLISKGMSSYPAPWTQPHFLPADDAAKIESPRSVELHPALLALARLLGRQAAAELISASIPMTKD